MIISTKNNICYLSFRHRKFIPDKLILFMNKYSKKWNPATDWTSRRFWFEIKLERIGVPSKFSPHMLSSSLSTPVHSLFLVDTHHLSQGSSKLPGKCTAVVPCRNHHWTNCTTLHRSIPVGKLKRKVTRAFKLNSFTLNYFLQYRSIMPFDI